MQTPVPDVRGGLARGVVARPAAAGLRLLLVHDDPSDAASLLAALDDGSQPVRSLRVDALPALDAALRSRDWDAALVCGSARRLPLVQALERLLRDGEVCPVLVAVHAGHAALAATALQAGAREVVDASDHGALRAALARVMRSGTGSGAGSAVDPTLALAQRLLAACDLHDGLAAALERGLDVVCRELGQPYGETWLRNPATNDLEPGPSVTSEARLRHVRHGARVASDDPFLREVVSTRSSRQLLDLGDPNRPRFERFREALALGLDGVTAVPVVYDGRVEAVLLTLGRRGSTADGRVVGALELIARQLRGALERAREGGAAALERARSAALLDLLADGVMACDADGRITLFNRAMERFHGTAVRSGVDPEGWARAYDLYRVDGVTPLPPGEMPLLRALRGETLDDARFVIAAPGVRRRAVRASASPLRGPGGTPAGALMIVHDDSERAAASAEAAAASERALRTFSLLLDHLADLALRVGEAERLDDMWPAFVDFAERALGADELYVVRGDLLSGEAPPPLEVLYAAARAATGHHAGAVVGDSAALDVSPVAREAIAARRLSLERDYAQRALRPDTNMRSAAAVPLTLGSDVLGALEVRAERPFAFDDGAAVALTMAATLAAIAIDHADMVDVERRSRVVAEAAARHFQQAFTANPAAVALVSLERRTVLDANPAMATLSGLPRAALIGADPVALGLWDAGAAERMRASGGVRGLEVRVRRADGEARTCLMSTETTELVHGDEREGALLILALDVTERLDQQRQLRDLARYRESLMAFIGETLDHGFDGAFYQRLLEAAVTATPKADAGRLLLREAHGDRYHVAAAVGYELEQLSDLSLDDEAVARREPLAGRDDMQASLLVPIEVDGRRVALVTLESLGDAHAFDVESVRLADAFAAQVATLLKRRSLEHELEHMAYHDTLTGLPNRALFLDRLQQAVARAQRSGGRGAALFVDLDNLKVTNDALGHAVGDALLCAVAERLRNAVRAEDTVARIGGDEFTLVLQQVSDANAAGRVADKLLQALREPFELQGYEVHVSASIGVTLFPDDAIDADTLVRHGDTAMYQAKAQGKDRYRFFTPEMNRSLLERASLEAQLRLALQRDEFTLAYQPRVALLDGRITSVEALARWHHPERGTIAPGTFIPVAEEAGLIGALGAVLLRRACLQGRAWHDAGTPTVIAFNLSARQLQERDIVQLVERTLAETGLDPGLLELELTESAVMHNVEENVVKLTQLRDLGVHVSIDDFGTAYSSLNYLKRLPATALKIDQSFVRDIGDDPDASRHDSAIVRAVVALASALDLVAIAEGIESLAQLRFLQSLGCAQGQGYLFARPSAPEALQPLLSDGFIRVA